MPVTPIESNVGGYWQAKQAEVGTPTAYNAATVRRLRLVDGGLKAVKEIGSEPYVDGQVFQDATPYVTRLGGDAGSVSIQAQIETAGFLFAQIIGADVVTGSNPNFVYTPPPASFRDERAFIVEGYDGDYTYRFIFRKGLNVATADLSFVREDPVMLPIEVSVLDDDSAENPWLLQTNDPEIGQFSLVGT